MFWDDLGVEWEFKKRGGGQDVRGRLLKCNLELFSVSGLVLECRYKLSLLEVYPSFVPCF